MPLHPAPPSDIHGRIEAYIRGLHAVIDLVTPCTAEQFQLPTACPGWSVHDQLSHVASAEAYLAGRHDPPVDVPPSAHVRSAFARRIEAGVELRRTRPSAEVLAELRDLVSLRHAQLRTTGGDADSMVTFHGRTLTFRRLVGLRIVDVWCHEQDIRHALGRPGNLDAVGASLFTRSILTELPTLVLAAGAEAGDTVIVDVTGPVQARSGVRVEEAAPMPVAAPVAVTQAATAGRDASFTSVARPPHAPSSGRLTTHVLYSGDSGDDSTGSLPDIASVTRIQLSTDALTRRAAGRLATEDVPYTVQGDEDLARRLLDIMVLTP